MDHSTTEHPPLPCRRRFLVLARTGARSLHAGWTRGAERRFDLVVSSFSGLSAGQAETADVAFAEPGPKYAPLGAYLSAQAGALRHYDAVWLPDDDIEADAATVNAMFDLVARTGVGLAQPALTPESPFSHGVTVAHRELVLRMTSFVEVMCPVFSREALAVCLPTFAESQSGWGLDHVWAALVQRAGLPLAVLDATPVRHTRPVGGGSLYETLAVSPLEEARALAARYAVDLDRAHTVSAALTRDGRLLEGTELARALLMTVEGAVAGNGQHVLRYVYPTLIEAVLAAPPAA